AAISGQQPHSVPHVQRQRVNDLESTLIPVRFLDLLDAAELAARRRERGVSREAASYVVLSERIYVRLELIAQLVVAMPKPDEAQNLQKQRSQRGHGSSPSKRSIIATVCCHVSASTAS